MGEGREHAGAYKLGMFKQKLEQMIGGTVSMQAAKGGNWAKAVSMQAHIKWGWTTNEVFNKG